ALNNDLKPQIAPAIEGAFNALNLKGSMDVAGSQLDYDFWPTDVQVHPGSIGIVMGGDFDAHNVADCADPQRGSAYLGAPLPVYTDVSPGGVTYDVAASLSGDTLNQLLFAAWRGGLLCRNIDQVGGSPL